jgi:hypothetical protein
MEVARNAFQQVQVGLVAMAAMVVAVVVVTGLEMVLGMDRACHAPQGTKAAS